MFSSLGLFWRSSSWLGCFLRRRWPLEKYWLPGLLSHLVKSRAGAAGSLLPSESPVVRPSLARLGEKPGTKGRVLRKGKPLPKHIICFCAPGSWPLTTEGRRRLPQPSAVRIPLEFPFLFPFTAVDRRVGSRQRGRVGVVQGSLWTGVSILVWLGPQAVHFFV